MIHCYHFNYTCHRNKRIA